MRISVASQFIYPFKPKFGLGNTGGSGEGEV
jgi:hypothetical protein